jgi:hypothetical protein
MARSITFQSRGFGRDPAQSYERTEGQSAYAKRMREEALVDIAALQRHVSKPPPKPAPRPAHKPLEEFLAEEESPKTWSEARRKAEALFSK